MREELGLDVLTVGPAEFAIADPGSRFEIVFVPVTVSGTPVCHEHMALAWLPLAELPSLPLAPSDRRFVELRLARAEAKPRTAQQSPETLLADLEAGRAPSSE